MTAGRFAIAAGGIVLALVTALTTLAWVSSSSARALPGGAVDRGAGGGLFLILLGLAFAAYLAGLALLRARGTTARAWLVVIVAVLVQAAPLGAPLLLSTDAWAYWSYGWIAARGDGNPYVDVPRADTSNPALDYMGSDWRATTSVYGPAFTLASEPLALAAGQSPVAAAWIYKGIAAAGAIAATLLAGRLSRRRALAVAFVGWNPVLAVHLAGGGHNDAWVGALLLAALALAASRRLDWAGVAWALAILVKWVPLVFLLLRAIEARASGREVRHRGFALALVAVASLAGWRYGLHWLEAIKPLAGNVAQKTSYALPSRLQQAAVPEWAALTITGIALAAGLAFLVRSSMRGRARPALAGCLILATTPYLAVWYLGWALPLAGADDDPVARIGCLALCVYLLPQTVPL